MIRGLKIKTIVPLNMTIADFWGNVVDTRNCMYEDDGVFTTISITSILDSESVDNGVIMRSPFGSFTLTREIDPDTKEPTGWYEIVSFDFEHRFGLSGDETIYDVISKMMVIVKELYRKTVENICYPDKYNPYVICRFDSSDLFWFVRKYGHRLGILYNIVDNELQVVRVSNCVFNDVEEF